MARLRTTSAVILVASLCVVCIGAGYWALDVIRGGPADAGDLPIVLVEGRDSVSRASPFGYGTVDDTDALRESTSSTSTAGWPASGRVVVGTAVRVRQAGIVGVSGGGSSTIGSSSTPSSSSAAAGGGSSDGGHHPADGSSGQTTAPKGSASGSGAAPTTGPTSTATAAPPGTTPTATTVAPGTTTTEHGGPAPGGSGLGSTSTVLGTPPTSTGHGAVPPGGDLGSATTGVTATGGDSGTERGGADRR